MPHLRASHCPEFFPVAGDPDRGAASSGFLSCKFDTLATPCPNKSIDARLFEHCYLGIVSEGGTRRRTARGEGGP